MKEMQGKGCERAGCIERLGRRGFLQKSAAGVAGAGMAALLGSTRAVAGDEKKTRLVMVSHPDATDNDGEGRADIVKRMVERSMKELTGKESLAEAWGTFFKPDDVVGLKVNVRGGRFLSTQPCVVDAIVAGLVAAGVKENNIIVWDAWTKELPIAGYTLNMTAEGGQPDHEPGTMLKPLFYGYCVGERSSRGIERQTYESVPFRVITVGQHPDHSTITEFRYLFSVLAL